jgi:hypothetical protein
MERSKTALAIARNSLDHYRAAKETASASVMSGS